MVSYNFSSKSDRIGALASMLCIIHCIATPFIFVIQPMSSQIESIPIWWKGMDFIFLMISFFAVYWTSKTTTKEDIKNLLWLSWVWLTVAIVNEKLVVLKLPEIMVYIPAIVLIILHIYNLKYCKCDDDGCCLESK